MNKRGQFFLIAAVVIVILLAGIGTIYNTVKARGEDAEVYDLTEELNYESAQVIDNGVYNDFEKEKIAGHLENLSVIYASTHPEKDLILVYGDVENVNVIYSNNTRLGSVRIGTGTGSPAVVQTPRSKYLIRNAFSSPGDKVEIQVGGSNYQFSLQQGGKFYLLMSKEKDDEKTVTRRG